MITLKKLQLVKEMITQLVVLLDYHYFKTYCEVTAIDLSKQQALDIDPKAIQQINLTRYLDRDGNMTMFFIIEEAKKNILNFSQRTVRAL